MKERYESIVIDVSIDPAQLEQLRELKDNCFLKTAEKVHIVHIYNERSDKFLPLEIGKTDKTAIERYINGELENLKKEISEDAKGEWFCQTLYNADAKLKSVDFLKEVNADLVILATRGLQGLEGVFKDSFAFYLVENAPCDVYVLRPQA
jgi:nucleotide-binding universal stress UspA family protein